MGRPENDIRLAGGSEGSAVVSPQSGAAVPEGDPAEDPVEATAVTGYRPPEHRWGFGAFLLVEGILLASAAFVSALLGRPPEGSPVPIGGVLAGTIAPTVIAALAALAITRVRGNGPVIDLRLTWRWDDVRVGLRFGVIGLVCTTLATIVWTQFVGDDNAGSAISALVEEQQMSIGAAVTMFLYLWLLGPICEEIIFRGMCWGAVERLNWGSEKWARLAAFVLSTAVFAVSHLEPLRTTLLLVISIPIGLARLFTGRLAGSIVAHQVNNFLPALAILLTALGLFHA